MATLKLNEVTVVRASPGLNLNEAQEIGDITGLQAALDAKVDDSAVGTAAAEDVGYFATAAQGTLAASALQSADINSLSELNAIVADATLIDTGDSRLSDARTPTSHTHTLSEVTNAGTAAAQDVGYFATAAQGALADSALQDADVGTAAAQDVGYFATSAQGDTADSAVQPLTPTDLNGGTALSLNKAYYDDFSSNRTLTISGTPSAGDKIQLRIRVASGTQTITFPSCNRSGTKTNPAAHAVDFEGTSGGRYTATLEYVDGAWWLNDDGAA